MRIAKRTLSLALALTLVISVAGLSLAAEAKKPFKKFHTIADFGMVKEVANGQLVGKIYDARPQRPKYDKGHIPGAMSLPWSKFRKMDASALPKDKDALLVFYCGGLKCPLSHKSAWKAEKLGYKNIYVYAAGMPDWKKNGGKVAKPVPAPNKTAFKKFPNTVDPAFVKQVSEGKTLGLIIDARPKRKKYDKGHVPGAVSLPWSKFQKMKGLLPADKDMLLVFYCGGLKCPLSHKSAFAARAMGYSNIKVFATGYPSWKKAYGAPVAVAAAKAAPAPQKAAKSGALKQGKEEGSVDLTAFEKIINQNSGSIMLVDVRDSGEFKSGHFKSAVNIPSDELEKKLPAMKVDKPLVFVCSTGARSGEAYYMVQDLRPDLKDKVYYLDGEITYQKNGSYKIKPNK